MQYPGLRNDIPASEPLSGEREPHEESPLPDTSGGGLHATFRTGPTPSPSDERGRTECQ